VHHLKEDLARYKNLVNEKNEEIERLKSRNYVLKESPSTYVIKENPNSYVLKENPSSYVIKESPKSYVVSDNGERVYLNSSNNINNNYVVRESPNANRVIRESPRIVRESSPFRYQQNISDSNVRIL